MFPEAQRDVERRATITLDDAIAPAARPLLLELGCISEFEREIIESSNLSELYMRPVSA